MRGFHVKGHADPQEICRAILQKFEWMSILKEKIKGVGQSIGDEANEFFSWVLGMEFRCSSNFLKADATRDNLPVISSGAL